MEFLGDAILGMIVSEYLFSTYTGHTEGELTAVKSIVVSRAHPGSAEPRARARPVPLGGARDEPRAAAAELGRGQCLRGARGGHLPRPGAGARPGNSSSRILQAEIRDAEQTKQHKNFKSVLQQLVQRQDAAARPPIASSRSRARTTPSRSASSR